VETDSVLLVRQRATPRRAWCARCAEFTELASFEDALTITSSDDAALSELIKTGTLHAINDINESLLICFLSIIRQMHKA
jgi:hypothetical protein